MSYSLVRSKRKSISLEFDDQAKLIVKAPTNTNIKYINDFVKSKQNWISKTQQKLYEKIDFTKEEFIIGGQVLFLGKKLTIKYSPKASTQKTNIRSYQNVIIDLINQTVWVATEQDELIEKQIGKAVRKKTEEIFQSTLDEMWAIFCVNNSQHKPNLKVRNMKRQWGNLKHTKPISTMTLNAKLVKAPKSCIESVVMHELCHIKHQNHQKQFYDLLLKYIPDYRQRRKLLSKYG